MILLKYRATENTHLQRIDRIFHLDLGIFINFHQIITLSIKSRIFILVKLKFITL